MRTLRLSLSAFTLVLALAVAPAHGAAKHPQSSGQGTGSLIGFGAGVLLPDGPFAKFNDPSYLIQSRSLFVKKIVGGRAGAYYGDTAGAKGEAGGRVYGFDFDVLVKFGSARTFGYVFAGAGYGTLTYTAADPSTTLPVRHGGHDWCWTGGVGVTIKRKFYLEASYVSYQTSPEATTFIPVVIGFQY